MPIFTAITAGISAVIGAATSVFAAGGVGAFVCGCSYEEPADRHTGRAE